MHGLNDLWVVGLKFSDVSGGSLNILLDFLKNDLQVLSIQRECMVECMLSLLACLHHYNSDLIHKVNLLHKHSGHPWTDKCYVLEVHVKSDCLHTVVTAQNLKKVQVFCYVIVDDLATVS